MNEAANVVLDNIDYNEILKIEKDKNSNVLKTDVVVINKIASDIALEAEKRFQELKDETIQIPIGAFLGNKYLAGMGPDINIKVISTGNSFRPLRIWDNPEPPPNITIFFIYFSFLLHFIKF